VAVTYAATSSTTAVNVTSFTTSTGTITAAAAGRVTEYATASFTPNVAGTYVIKLTSANAVNNAYITWTITAVAKGAISAASSTAYIGAGTTAVSADVAVAAIKSASAAVANVTVTESNGSTTGALASGDAVALTATVSGPGLVSFSSTVGTGARAITNSSAALTQTLYIFADGTAGTGTVTISAGTTVLATKTVTFYGALASLKATVAHTVAASGSATTGAVTVVGYDSNGNLVPSQGLTITSADTTKVASFTATSSAAADVTAGTATVSVTGITGKFGPVALTIADTATGLVATTVTVNVSNTTATALVLSSDKASYAPGEKITYTIKGTDVNGVAVADLASTASAYTWVTNVVPGGSSSFPTAATWTSGAQTFSVYAPATTGTFTATATLATTANAIASTLNATTLVASVVVAGDTTAVDAAQAAQDAANEATDAANAATDAANNAMDSADAAQQAAMDAGDKADAALAAVTDLATKVSEIATQISALSAVVAKVAAAVAKISAKVKA
jgi:hypothetical protein